MAPLDFVQNALRAFLHSQQVKASVSRAAQDSVGSNQLLTGAGQIAWTKSRAVRAQGKHHLELSQPAPEDFFQTHAQVAFTLKPYFPGPTVLALNMFRAPTRASLPPPLSHQ